MIISSSFKCDVPYKKYKLIKNIPGGAIAMSAGIAPFQRYQEEIKKVEAAGEKFFERG